ncbi:MAG: succinate--CoA ligase subunit alpha [Candidatus Marsarchaeota archaeon]|nr:succinate--CoA ligase subunit alpha [Candidatus Marsarchaeota archaeon]
MAILVDSNTKVIVQGITGKQGEFHAQQMIAYGTKVVGGVTPGKGGSTAATSVPVFDTVDQAVKATGANTSIVFVPPPNAKDAIMESADAGVQLTVVITEHIPPLDAWKAIALASKLGTRVIGPNCPGVVSPGKSKVGIMPNPIFSPGGVGVVSRSGTLTYEVAYQLTRAGLGQSSVVGIGGDPVVGTSFTEVLAMFEDDPETRAVVLLGEIGGDAEEKAAEYISARMTKPVVAYVAGRTAPAGKRMGHAGAIVSGTEGTAETKIKTLELAGVRVAETPSEIPRLLAPSLR